VALQPGARLGPYDLIDSLGAGGMGEVYRAHDSRLSRDVAVKVLPPEFTSDPDRLHRFEQEGRALAALNHPNVMAVFDVGIADGIPYVVSELLEGQTLRDLLLHGALPLRKATSLAVQIASGMAAAHEKGIVHRDLKPGNIFVTEDGRAKILDFGLAKLAAPGVSANTDTRTMTTPGVAMGTAGYMSPEQVRGEAVDHRTDIFAFGAVLYEMLSGQRAFSGDIGVEIMTAILKQDPPPLPARSVPPHLDRLVHRCLEKGPSERFQSARDLAFALEAAAPASTMAPALEEAPPKRAASPLLIGAGVVAGLAIGAAVMSQLAPAPTGGVTFEAMTFDRLPVTNARFMPDGQTIVYSATPQGYTPDLFILSPSSEAPRPLGISNAHLLSISSKGELAMIVGAQHIEQRLYSGTLARMTLGSSPRPMLENVREADWAPDGESMAIIHDLGNGRDRLEYPAGTARYEAGGYLSDPRVSPDGSQVAFFEHQWRFDDRGWVKVVDQHGTVTTLAGELWGLEGMAWTPDGSRIVFSGSASGGTTMQPMVVAVDGSEPARGLIDVPARFIVHDVARDGRWLAVREDLSLGVRALVPGHSAERDLTWLGSTGARSLSRDAAWLLMVDVGLRGGRNYGVVLRRTDGSQTIRLGEGSAQRLSADGEWASAIVATPPGLVAYPTGPGDAVRIGAGTFDRFISAEWFPDGRRMLVCGSEPARGPRCYAQDLVGSPPVPVAPESVMASLAPDGRTLLLTLPDGGYQLSSVDGGTPQTVTALKATDRQIAWSRDSRAVYVQQGTEAPARVERVDLATGARAIVRDVFPEGLTAVTMISVVDWVDDGGWFVYNYTTLPSILFVVTGAIG
jgi:Tol biopolymer transport system component